MNIDQLVFENLLMDLQLIRWGNLTKDELNRLTEAVTQAKKKAEEERQKRGKE